MAGDNDDLETNPFYKALQEKFLPTFERAQQSCYWICVPHSDSINSSHLDKVFTETHVLRPSALFKGHFENLCSSKVKSCHLSDDSKYVIVDIYNGKGQELKIKILSEELAYNKDLKPYKILLIEKPLHPSYEAQPKGKDQLTKYFHTPKLSYKECTDFLMSFVDSKQNMDELNENIAYFNRHYMVLEDYLDDAMKRISEICTQAFKNVVKSIKRPLNQDSKLHSTLAGAIESYVMHDLYPKIFPIIRQRMNKENRLMVNKCEKLNKVKPEQVGVPKEFACPLPSAVVELANLGSLQTPKEKLVCLKSTIDSTTQEVSTFIQESQWVGMSLEHQPCITSDDLIPLLVVVIARTKCTHLPSDLFYIENFTWDVADRDNDSDNLSFCLVSFKAALQYMISTDFCHLEEKKSYHEKEIGIEELMRAKQQKKTNPINDKRSFSFDTSGPRTDRLERQLSRISSLVEKASLEESNLPDRRNKHRIQSNFPDRIMRDPAPDLIPEQEKNNANPLGDFLTSLQRDAFDQPFGKQS